MIRTGLFAVFINEEFELILKNPKMCTLLVRSDKISDYHRELGFSQYSKGIYTLDVEKSRIDSAFQVLTFCHYQGAKFQVDKILLNNKVRIWHSLEAQEQFNDHARHGYDPHLAVEEEALESIWEERQKVSGFAYEVEKIKYLKRGNNI